MTTETFFANFGHLADAPNGVQKLRELILQLAAQGKLVPQDPNDESASVLLERIEAEKQRLRTAEKIKLPQNLLPIKDDEISTKLPSSWQWVRLEGVFYSISTGNKKVNTRDILNEGKFPVVDQGQSYISGYINDKSKVIHIPGPVVVFGDHTRAVKYVDFDFVGGADGIKVLRSVGIFERYFFKVLESYNLEGRGYGRHYKVLLSNLFPLPPLSEQKRIVAKVDQIMTMCDELETRQKKQQQTRVRLNNAALDKLLTAREPNESADHWQRICTNFDLLYDHPETIAKLRAAVLQLAVQGKLAPQEKPELWREGTLGDVVESSEAGWSPQCENRPCTGEEWGVLKVSAVTWGEFIPGENKTLPRHLEPRPRYAVIEGDFLISRANTSELVARSVVVDRDYPRLMMSDKIIRVRFRKEADPNFFNLVNNAPFSREYYARVAGGTSSSMKNVSRKQILELPVIIPPLAEQKRIVAKVNQLMALCDKLETKLNQTQQHSEKLMEATVRQLLVA